jgi:hypothetical protein
LTYHEPDIHGDFHPHPEPFATVIEPAQTIGDGHVFVIETPARAVKSSVSGLFFLARCGVESEQQRDASWNYYAPCTLYAVTRRPMFAQGQVQSEHWTLLLPPPHDWRHDWLLSRQHGDRILLFGPMGNPWENPALGPHSHLLTIGDSSRVLVFRNAIENLLDQGGRATVVLAANSSHKSNARSLSKSFPLQVEVQEVDQIVDSSSLRDLLRWADITIADLESDALYRLAQTIRAARLVGISRNRATSESDAFAYALARGDFLCGYGACLACVVPTAGGGVTRACVHGPIFPLSTLVAG